MIWNKYIRAYEKETKKTRINRGILYEVHYTIISLGFLDEEILFWANLKTDFALAQNSQDKDENNRCC